MRDKIASTISKNITLEDGVFVGGFFDAADAIIAVLPDYDVQKARIKELESLLLKAADDIEKGWLSIEGVEETYNTDGSWHVVQDIRAALKGED